MDNANINIISKTDPVTITIDCNRNHDKPVRFELDGEQKEELRVTQIALLGILETIEELLRLNDEGTLTRPEYRYLNRRINGNRNLYDFGC